MLGATCRNQGVQWQGSSRQQEGSNLEKVWPYALVKPLDSFGFNHRD